MTENLDQDITTQIFFIVEKAKETVQDFAKGTVKALWFFFFFNLILT